MITGFKLLSVQPKINGLKIHLSATSQNAEHNWYFFRLIVWHNKEYVKNVYGDGHNTKHIALDISPKLKLCNL